MIGDFLAKLRARDDVSAEEEQALRGVLTTTRSYKRGACVVRTGEEIFNSMLLIEGYSCRSKVMRDGSRQILELNIPGDFVDLHGLLLHRLDHNIEALTDCAFALAPHDQLRTITAQYPHLTRLLWKQTVIDAAIHRETVTSIARRSALARIAHFFVEVQTRLAVIGRDSSGGFDLPINQLELGELTGLTPVHVSRTLKVLREHGQVTFRRGRVTIHDPAALRETAEWDPLYLSLQKQPR